jgi:hypothetical protein
MKNVFIVFAVLIGPISYGLSYEYNHVHGLIVYYHNNHKPPENINIPNQHIQKITLDAPAFLTSQNFDQLSIDLVIMGIESIRHFSLERRIYDLRAFEKTKLPKAIVKNLVQIMPCYDVQCLSIYGYDLAQWDSETWFDLMSNEMTINVMS